MRSIRRSWLLGLALAVAFGATLGCGPKAPDAPATSTEPSPSAGTTGGSVGITTAGAGGVAPVTGSESVTGAGGGGVNQAAKAAAQRAAGQAAGGSAAGATTGE